MRKVYFALAILAMLLGCGTSFAQQNCHDLSALNAQSLGPQGWFLVPGSTRGVFDHQLLSPYFIDYIPGESAYPSIVAGRYWDFTQIWHFRDIHGNEIGTFTVSNYHSSFPLPIGKAGLGMYNGTGKITSGTGIFDGAAGKVHESGPFIIWFGEDGNVYGQYNATYIVRVCMN
jgi:hypothetical protein